MWNIHPVKKTMRFAQKRWREAPLLGQEDTTLKLTPEFVATQNGVRITHNMVPLTSKSEAESACSYNN